MQNKIKGCLHDVNFVLFIMFTLVLFAVSCHGCSWQCSKCTSEQQPTKDKVVEAQKDTSRVSTNPIDSLKQN